MSTGSIAARLKEHAGDIGPLTQETVAAAFTLQLDPTDAVRELTCTASRASADAFLIAPKILPGRRLTLMNVNGSGFDITLSATTAGAAADGTMVAGGDIVLGDLQAITLVQRANGSWIRHV